MLGDVLEIDGVLAVESLVLTGVLAVELLVLTGMLAITNFTPQIQRQFNVEPILPVVFHGEFSALFKEKSAAWKRKTV